MWTTINRTLTTLLLGIGLWHGFAMKSSAAADLIDGMEDTARWVLRGSPASQKNLARVPGKEGSAIGFTYTLDQTGFVELSRPVELDLSNKDTIGFQLKGEGPSDTLQIKLEDADGSIFAKSMASATLTKDWTSFQIPIGDFQYFLGGDKKLDASKIRRISFVVAAKQPGMKGSVAVDELRAWSASPGEAERISSEKVRTPGRNEVIDTMDNIEGWSSGSQQGSSCQMSAAKLDGRSAVCLDFSMKPEGWGQIVKVIDRDLSWGNTIRFKFKGEGELCDFKIMIEDAGGSFYGYLWSGIKGSTNNGEWLTLDVPLSNLTFFWGKNRQLNMNHIAKIYFVVARPEMEGTDAKTGKIYLDDIQFVYVNDNRFVKQDAYHPAEKKDAAVAKKAAQWLGSQQQDWGLVLSFIGDKHPFAWTYDQALSLIVFSREDKTRADRLMSRLAALQNEDGSWYDGYDIEKKEKATDNKWVGSIAWTTFAITQYVDAGGDPRYLENAKKAIAFLKKLQRPNGSFHVSTEGNLDCWWALQAMGETEMANQLKQYLLDGAWNYSQKRFNPGTKDDSIYLDVQTWGSAFARAAGDDEKGLYALGFGGSLLRCKTFDGSIQGLDTQGPFTVWNEGTLHWIDAGGADSDLFLAEMNKQQAPDGSLQHSHENFSTSGVWHVTMPGVAPTAWLYFANTRTPYVVGKCKALK